MGRRSRVPFYLMLFFVCGVLGVGGFLLFRDMAGPEIELVPELSRVAPDRTLTVTATDTASGVRKIQVVARRNGHPLPVVEQSFPDREPVRTVSFTLKDTGLRDAAIELEISATDGSLAGFGQGNTATRVYPLRIDGTPPRISVKTPVPYVRRGGTGCVVYGVSKEVTQTGIKLGEYFFPGFRQENGDYLSFFAFPYNMEPRDFQPQLVAVDIAGNSQVTALPVNRINRTFKSDTLSIGQNFLQMKSAEFAQSVEGNLSDLDLFLEFNGRIRRENARTLLDVGKNTAPEMLWSGVFVRLPNSANRAGFADHRTYLWEGQKVDEQTHLGLDLASVAQADVPAANAGTVVFAGYLGIYGYLVVLDHGLGLQSLYAHLSEIGVSQGQELSKGEILGRTGATGMAGGDHLHFGILVSGLEVTPIEWLDPKWIRDNITDRIKAAGGTTP